MITNKKILSLTREELTSGGRIPIDVFTDSDTLFRHIARTVADELKHYSNLNKKALFIMPLGPVGQYPYLAEIINNERISLKNITFINMDEYMIDEKTLISKEDSLSFENTMYRLFYNRINQDLLMEKEKRVFPNLTNGEYITKLIEENGGVDFCLGGIGVDGHIAFNEPIENMSIKDFCALSTRVIKIAKETLVTNGIMEFGGAYEFMPTYAITLGFKEIMQAKKIRLYSFMPWHKMVVRKASFYEPQTAFPVTLLQGKDIRIGIPESIA